MGTQGHVAGYHQSHSLSPSGTRRANGAVGWQRMARSRCRVPAVVTCHGSDLGSQGKKWPVSLPPNCATGAPFVLDLLGNLFQFFDTVQNFDDLLHFINWMFLCAAFVAMFDPVKLAPWNRAALGTGFGAFAIILWEFMEYLIMQSGTTGLHLSYEDTVTDLLLSSCGGLVGSLVMVRLATKRL